MKGKRNQGVSLIELLLVVAIIVIITLIVVYNVREARRNANEREAVATMRSLAEACEADGTQCDMIFEKSGYAFAVRPQATGAFAVTAVPVQAGVTGKNAFALFSWSKSEKGYDVIAKPGGMAPSSLNEEGVKRLE